MRADSRTGLSRLIPPTTTVRRPQRHHGDSHDTAATRFRLVESDWHRPVRWEREPVRANPAASGRWAPIGSMETCPAHCHGGHGPCDDGFGLPGRRRGQRESRIVEHSRQSAWYPTASAIPRLATDRDGPPAHPEFLHHRHRVLPGRTAHRRRRSQRPRAEGQSLRSPDRPVGQAADSAGSTARLGPVRRVLARPDEAWRAFCQAILGSAEFRRLLAETGVR